jgi:hypothetical protein
MRPAGLGCSWRRQRRDGRTHQAVFPLRCRETCRTRGRQGACLQIVVVEIEQHAIERQPQLAAAARCFHHARRVGIEGGADERVGRCGRTVSRRRVIWKHRFGRPGHGVGIGRARHDAGGLGAAPPNQQQRCDDARGTAHRAIVDQRTNPVKSTRIHRRVDSPGLRDQRGVKAQA